MDIASANAMAASISQSVTITGGQTEEVGQAKNVFVGTDMSEVSKSCITAAIH
jgi:hypothetical protein